MTDDANDITLLLRRYQGGDEDALSTLTQQLYPMLKRMARIRASGSDMNASTLVQETYVRFLGSKATRPDDRKQFFGLAATIMRRVVVDETRRQATTKRRAIRVDADQQHLQDDSSIRAEFIAQVDAALTEVSKKDERLVRVFECRYFMGMSTAETADALEMSVRTVERLWSQARASIAEQVDR